MKAPKTNSVSDSIFQFMFRFVIALLWKGHEKHFHTVFFFLCDSYSTFSRFLLSISHKMTDSSKLICFSSETYSEPNESSKMKLFAKIVND